MTSLFRKLRWWANRDRKEEELREELRFHLDEEAERRREDGLAADQAQWAARRDLGNITVLEEKVRAVWTWTILEQLVQDLRYALRAMNRNRAFTALTTLSLALGIGANTAIYSFMDSILLRSLPVADPASLVVLQWRSKPIATSMGVLEGSSTDGPSFVMHSMSGAAYGDPKTGITAGIFPFPAFELLQKSSESVLSSVFAYYPARNLNLVIKGQADVANGEYVSGDYFRGLAVPPAAGRLLMADDDRAGALAVVVVSMGFSQQRFGNAANAVGQSIDINGQPFRVIGVTPSEFFGVDPAAAPELYLPMHANLVLDVGLWGTTPQTYLDQNYYWIGMMGRLRPGVSLTEAQSTLTPLFQQWVAGTASNARERANLPSMWLAAGGGGLDKLRRQYSKPLFMLLTLVGLILAVACANTANLLLARAAARTREMAVRLSIGAGRFRLIRQLLTESLLLALLGGTLGVLFALWGIRVLTLLLANGHEHFTLHAEMNGHVLAATLAVSLLCGTLVGLAPAIQSTRADVMPALKDARARGRSPRRAILGMNISQVLVASQIGISLLLLVVAGLFVETLSNLQSVQLGFNRDNVLLFDVNAHQAGHRDLEIAAFYADLRRRVGAIPGVSDASLSHSSLIEAGRQLPISVSGTPAPGTRILGTGPAFFTTMQIPMLVGREIDERDQPGSPSVAVVNDLFAKAHFGQENPVGRHISLDGPTPRDMEIVGVSANVRYQDLKEDFLPIVFIPYNQGSYPPLEQMTYAMRTTGNPLLYVKVVRDIVHQADARVPLTNVKTQAAEIDQTMNQEILFARLCSAFAILTLVIACVGLYGTTTYAVARRTGEIGLRMALGAGRATVVWMVLRDVSRLAAVGLAIGVPAALGASRLVESFLFGLRPNDPWAVTCAVGILLGAALVAGYVPARRASRIDPMTALRHE
jgi:macrolide transport system ATP-binding/permease protein